MKTYQDIELESRIYTKSHNYVRELILNRNVQSANIDGISIF